MTTPMDTEKEGATGWVSGKPQRDRRRHNRRHDDHDERDLLRRAIALVGSEDPGGDDFSTAVLRRADDHRYHGLNNRLHIVENRVEHAVTVLVGQREMSKELMAEVRTNSKDIGDLRSEVSSTESRVLAAIAQHAEKDSRAMASHAKTAFWTLLAVLLTGLVSFGGYVAEKLSIWPY